MDTTIYIPQPYPSQHRCVPIPESRTDVSALEIQLKEIVRLLTKRTPSKFYNEEVVSDTTSFVPYKVNEFLNENAESIIVTNDGPGTITIVYSDDGKYYSKEFILYEGEASKFFNIHTVLVKSTLIGSSYRLTEFDLRIIGDGDYYSDKQCFTDQAITDVVSHNSLIFDSVRYKIITFYIANTLDQDITIQVRANRSNSTTGSVTVGSTFTVAATTGIEARTVWVNNDGWLPYYYITAIATVAPTSGSLNCYISGRN